MNFVQKNSIKRKLINLSIVTNSLILVLACLAFLIHDVLIFRNGIIRNVVAQAETVGFNSGAAILFKDSKSAQQTLSALQTRPSISVAGIYNEQDKAFAIWTRQKNAVQQLPPLDEKLKKGHRFAPGSLEVVRP